MNKVVFLADLHLSGYLSSEIDSKTNLSKKLLDIKNTIYNVCSYCRQENIKKISILGDLLHDKSKIFSVALNVLLDLFRDNSDIEFIILSGNHDLSSKGELSVSSLKCLDKEPNVHRIIDSEIIDNIFYVSYSSTMVDTIKKGSCKYLASHFGLNEATLNSGISIISDISMKDLDKKYEKIFVGHYHKPQHIKSLNSELYYIGSPTELDWGEKNDEKRFIILDIETGDIQSIPTWGFTKHYEFEINNSNRTEIIKKVKELQKQGHKVKLKKNENIDLVEISSETIIIDKIERDITNRGINSSMTEEERLIKYMDIKDINSDDKNRYLNLAKDILLNSLEKEI